jgi:thioredoxin-like negative regulator of GroEL
MIFETSDESFIEDVFKSGKSCVVKFKNNDCYLCNNLAPIYTKIAEKYKDRFKFFVADTLKNEKLNDFFIKNGVPTLYIFGSKNAYEIPDPSEPHEQTWFTKKYIEKMLLSFLKEENK